jgi:hypothetical protein
LLGRGFPGVLGERTAAASHAGTHSHTLPSQKLPQTKPSRSQATHPSIAVFLQRATTVPALGLVDTTSITIDPSAQRMAAPGLTSCASLG